MGSSLVRKQENKIVDHQRKALKREFELAERTLNAAWAIATNTVVNHPGGDPAAGRIMLGLYAKMLNIHLSIIVLTERALPTGSVMREMAEALINLALMTTNPGALAEKYRDGIVLRAQKDLSRMRASADPEVRSRVRDEDVRLIEEEVGEIRQRRGADEIEQMRRYGWAGTSIEQRAKDSSLPPILYEGLYAVDSRATHAMDASDYLQVDEEGNATIRLASGRTLNHLMPQWLSPSKPWKSSMAFSCWVGAKRSRVSISRCTNLMPS